MSLPAPQSVQRRMYESHQQTPLPRSRFALRFLGHVLVALLLVTVSLGIGIAGYMRFEHLPLLDAFLNSAMLLGGMGPVNAPLTAAGKLFAGVYALYAGLVFIVSAATIFTPLVHRVMHQLHWGGEE